MDGLNVLGILKADTGLCDVPVLLVTQEADTVSRELGIAMGAQHCLFKPYRPLEIQQRLREIIDASNPDEKTNRRSNGTPARDIADPLTQLGTSSQLHISLDYEFVRAVRYRHALSCVVIACANRDELTQRLGKRAPAVVIAPMANIIKGGIRTVDHLFRSGEYEFTILLPETQQEGARIVVERLRAILREHNSLPNNDDVRPIIGVSAATVPFEGVLDGEALYALARRGLR
jgi:diguanylate cyclase (GGDEF)-like protein